MTIKKTMFLKKFTIIILLSFLLISLSRVYAFDYYPVETYDELYQAFQNEEKVELLKDIVIENNGSNYLKTLQGKNINLNLNGKEISNGTSAKLLNDRLIVVDGGKLELTNGNIDAKGAGKTTSTGTGAYGSVRVNSGVGIFKDIHLKNYRPNGLNIKIMEDGKSTLENVTIDSIYGGGIEVAGGEADMVNCTINQTGYNDWCSTAISVSNQGTLNVYSGNYISENYGAYIFSSGGTINIHGGKFEAKSKPVLKADADLASYPDSYGYINIYGGTFKGTLSISSDDQLNIHAGVFENTGLTKERFSQYVDEKSVVYENNSIFTVAPKATSINLSHKNISLVMGSTSTLTGNVLPKQSLEEIIWKSSNENIVKVDNKGKIITVGNGEAIITATAGSVSAECKVIVYSIEEPEIPPFDSSKPVDDVTIGITDDESKEIINDTGYQLIQDISNGVAVDESVVSSETLEKIKEAIADGKTITFKVESQIVSKTNIPVAEINEIDRVINSLASENKTEVVVAQYLDLGIALQAGNEKLGNFNKLDGAITFTVAIPDDLKSEERKFYVVRIHDGVSTILNTTQNADGTISFDTDSFSTYALVYEDQKAVTSNPDTTKPSNPVQTNDSTSVVPLMIMFGLSVFIGTRQLFIKKKYTDL